MRLPYDEEYSRPVDSHEETAASSRVLLILDQTHVGDDDQAKEEDEQYSLENDTD